MFLRRRHVTAATAGRGHHRCHSRSGGRVFGVLRHLRARRGRAGREAVPGRRRVIPRRGRIEPLAKRFGACAVRAAAAAATTAPTGQRRAPALVDPDDRSHDRHPERSAAQLDRSRPLPGSNQAPTGADQGARDVRSGTRPGNPGSGPGHDTPAAATAATAATAKTSL